MRTSKRAPLRCRCKVSLPKTQALTSPGEVSSRDLAVLFAIDGRGLGEIGVGVLHELRLGLLIAEAIGLALDGAIDRAVGLHLFTVGKTPAAHIVELSGCGDGSHGEAERKGAG